MTRACIGPWSGTAPTDGCRIKTGIVRNIWTIIPPWAYAMLVGWLGRWGESRWAPSGDAVEQSTVPPAPTVTLGHGAITTLVFLSLLPSALLTILGPMIPFEGARAGLALGIVAFLFGCVPMRLLDVRGRGWDLTLWMILVDLLRVGGALSIVGALLTF